MIWHVLNALVAIGTWEAFKWAGDKIHLKRHDTLGDYKVTRDQDGNPTIVHLKGAISEAKAQAIRQEFKDGTYTLQQVRAMHEETA